MDPTGRISVDRFDSPTSPGFTDGDGHRELDSAGRGSQVSRRGTQFTSNLQSFWESFRQVLFWGVNDSQERKDYVIFLFGEVVGA